MVQIEEAIASTEAAILWIAEEHRYLKELIDFIKRIKSLDIEQQEKDLKIAFRLYRWAEAAEKRAQQAEMRAEIELKGIAKALPKKWHDQLIEIISQLDDVSKEFLKKSTPFLRSIEDLRFVGHVFEDNYDSEAAKLFYSEPDTKEFKELKAKYKQDYAEFKQKKEELTAEVKVLLEKLSSDIEKTTKLLDSVEAILKRARAFETKIEEAITEQAVQNYLRYWPAARDEIKKGNIPWQDLIRCIPKINVYIPEAILLFPFMENIVKLCLEKKIDTIIALDKSGRLLGVLAHQVLLNLGAFKGIEFYFIHPSRLNLYRSKKMIEKFKNRQILVIDEYIYGGGSMANILQMIKSILNKKAYTAVFSAIASEKIPYGNIGQEYAVYDKVPSWYFFKEYSGVKEVKEIAFATYLKAEPRTREIAAAVREALIPLAKVIAQYLKNRGY